MKSFKTYWHLAAVMAFLFTLAACSDDEEGPIAEEYDDAYYAALASVSSSDAGFTSSGNGGTILFGTEGGSVVVNVDCGTSWTVVNPAADIFATAVDSAAGTLTVTTGRNTVEEDITYDISLITSRQRVEFAAITLIQQAYDAPTISVGVSEWHVPANGDLSTEIDVDCSLGDFDVEVSDDWLTYAKTGTGISLTAEENGDVEARDATVVVSATDGVRTVSGAVTVTQDPKAYLNLSGEELGLYEVGESSYVTIDTNYDWDFTYDTSDGWFTLERDGNKLRATVTADVEEGREATASITAGDGAENYAEAQVTVIKRGGDAMVLEYTVTSTVNNIVLPLAGTVNCEVDWGDGTGLEAVTSTYPSHTYAEAGVYDVHITGTVTALNSNNSLVASSSARNTTLTAVRKWGKTGLTDLTDAFRYNSGLVSVPADEDGAFSEVESCKQMFYYCTSLTSVADHLFAGCTKNKTLNQVFRGCESLREVPADLFCGSGNVTDCYGIFASTAIESVPKGLFDYFSSATTFECTFHMCASLVTIPKGLFDNCPEVTSFDATFYGCNKLAPIPDGLFDKCVKAVDFHCVFYMCYALTEIPKGLFDNNPLVTRFSSVFGYDTGIESIPEGLFDNCTEVTDFNCAFYGCNITSIPAGLFDSCTKVTNFDSTFSFCHALEDVPEGLFKNCTEVTRAPDLFQQCTSLKTIPAGLFDAFSKVTDLHYAFNTCLILESIPEGLLDYCEAATNMKGVFQGCESAECVPVGMFDNCRKVTDFSYTCYGCMSATGESPYTEINGEKVHLYERENYPETFETPTTHNTCFTNCTKMDDYYDIPSGWGGGKSTSSLSLDKNVKRYAVEETMCNADGTVEKAIRYIEL